MMMVISPKRRRVREAWRRCSRCSAACIAATTSSVSRLSAGRSADIGCLLLLHRRDGRAQRAQAARDAGARRLLGDLQPRRDVLVLELVDDAQPDRVALVGGQPLE